MNLILFLLTIVGIIVLHAYGITLQWLFRPKEHRRIGRLLRGALVMGPEGWMSTSSNRKGTWRTQKGHIRLETNTEYGTEDVTFMVNGIKVPLTYFRDRLLVSNTLRRWDKRRAHAEKLTELRGTISEVESHLLECEQEYDALDERVVKARLAGRETIS